MKKIFPILMMCVLTVPALANEYGYDSTPKRDNYVGIRIHKNENIAFGIEPGVGDGWTLREDSFGFGAMVGNRLTDHIKIEFETEYTYAKQSGYNFNVWANMLNVYLYQQFGGAVEPFVGLGVGVSGLWGDADNGMNDATADMSWGAMAGVNFALNERVDLSLGVKYQNYGDLNLQGNGNSASVEVDGTELYISAAYKFGL